MLNGIDSYYLYLINQNTLINSKSTYYENVNIKEVDFMNGLKSKQRINSWFLTYPFEEGITGFSKSRLIDDRLITYNKLLINAKGTTEAVLAINVDTNFISDNFNKIQTKHPAIIFYEILAKHP